MAHRACTYGPMLLPSRDLPETSASPRWLPRKGPGLRRQPCAFCRRIVCALGVLRGGRAGGVLHTATANVAYSVQHRYRVLPCICLCPNVPPMCPHCQRRVVPIHPCNMPCTCTSCILVRAQKSVLLSDLVERVEVSTCTRVHKLLHAGIFVAALHAPPAAASLPVGTRVPTCGGLPRTPHTRPPIGPCAACRAALVRMPFRGDGWHPSMLMLVLGRVGICPCKCMQSA